MYYVLYTDSSINCIYICFGLFICRSQPTPIDVSNIANTKGIRFYNRSQPMQLSRQDFSLHEAWTRFLIFFRYKNRQIESLPTKDAPKTRTIGNIRVLVTTFREDNAYAAADYLQVI